MAPSDEGGELVNPNTFYLISIFDTCIRHCFYVRYAKISVVMGMQVYADVLVVLNLIVDYFLLSAAARLLHINPPFWRQLIAAILGGISSLIIFLPTQGFVLELFIQLSVCIIMSYTAFGFVSLRRFVRAAAVLFGVTFGYGGGMMALWYALRPNGMVINNSVVYFDISPVFLILFSVVGYIAVSVLRRLFGANGVSSSLCTAEIFIDGNSRVFSVLVDTGNSLEDTFSNSEVIIADSNAVKSLLGFIPKAENLPDRYRIIAGTGVTGQALLDGFRCDRAVITYSGRKIELHRPILAISQQPLGGDYDAIINPRTVL